ncbi:VC0807 family protein [Streptomyces sp. IBSBF 2435]|uniref:VC0807 family protein n=1 Tax=Streptomyces sp. IBSBF 2435 TaxID=2903531 RepID=UPI002FDBEB60
MTDARTHDPTGRSSASSHAHAVLLSWGPTVLFGMLLPWVTYHQLTGRGVHGGPALMLVAAWPALEIGLYFALHHRADEFGMLILLALLLATAGTAVGTGGRAVGVRADTALAGLTGVAFALSLAFGRPLTFWFGRRFATDGSAAATVRWTGLWTRDAGFRAMQRRLTTAWATGCLLVAGTTAAAPRLHGSDAALSYACSVVVISAVTAYTVRAGRTWAEARQTPAAPSSAPTA